MSKTIALTAVATFAIAFAITPVPAQAGWKLCIRQECTVQKAKPPCIAEYCGTLYRTCRNVLTECPSSGEHIGKITSNGKGSNF